MAGVALGAIYARLGIETQQFSYGLKQSSAELAAFSSRAGKGSVDLERMGASGLRVGNVLAGMARTGTVSLSQLAEMIGSSSIAVAGLVGAYQIWSVAVDKAMERTKTALPPQQEFVATLAESDEAFDSAAAQLMRLNRVFELNLPIQDMVKERTYGNAAAIADMLDRVKQETEGIKAKNAAQKAAADAVAKHAEAQRNALPLYQQIQNALVKGREEFASFADQARKTWNILNEEELRANIATIEEEFRAIGASGGSADDIIEKMGPNILELAEHARRMGTDTTATFDDLADAIRNKSALAVDDLIRGFKSVPEETRKSADASRRVLDELAAQYAANPLVIPVKVQVDPADIQRQVAIAMQAPNTSGHLGRG